MARASLLVESDTVTCPHCRISHLVENHKVRVLNEQCYFTCPGDGKEFEIIVR